MPHPYKPTNHPSHNTLHIHTGHGPRAAAGRAPVDVVVGGGGVRDEGVPPQHQRRGEEELRGRDCGGLERVYTTQFIHPSDACWYDIHTHLDEEEEGRKGARGGVGGPIRARVAFDVVKTGAAVRELAL